VPGRPEEESDGPTANLRLLLTNGDLTWPGNAALGRLRPVPEAGAGVAGFSREWRRPPGQRREAYPPPVWPASGPVGGGSREFAGAELPEPVRGEAAAASLRLQDGLLVLGRERGARPASVACGPPSLADRHRLETTRAFRNGLGSIRGWGRRRFQAPRFENR